MQNESSSTARVIEALGRLAEAYVSLLRHELMAGASHAVAALLGGFLIIAMFGLALLFVNIALAVVLGTFLGIWAGFLIVAVAYLAFAVWILFKFNFIRKKIENLIRLFSQND